MCNIFIHTFTLENKFLSFCILYQIDIPETLVRLGASLDPDAIREGTDVYFDCIVSAHPAVYKVEWRHNVRKGFLHTHNILVQ